MTKCMLSEKTMNIFNDYKMDLRSEDTRKEYYYVINSFCKYSEKDYLEANLEDFIYYFDHLDTAAAVGKLSYKTMCARYTILINFSTYIVAHAYQYGVKGFSNYMAKVEKPKVSINIKSKNIPNLEQLDKIYEASQHDGLMYCVIALVNKCGLTVNQICNLKLTNFILDSENNSGIIFPYQYSADKYIKLPSDVRAILSDYIENIRDTNTEYLFCNKKKGKLTSRVLQFRMKKIINIAASGEDWDFSLQDLRNMSVVLMLQGGADKEDVAEYIGVEMKWMQRYDRAVEEFIISPVDFINIDIKRIRRN